MMLPQDWLLDMDVDGVQRVSTSEMTCKYSIPQTELGNQYYDEKVDILIEPDRIAEGNGLNTHRSLCSGTTTSCIGYKSYHPECNKSTVYKVKDNVDHRTMGDDYPTRSHHSDLACSRSSRYSKFDDKYLAFVGDANEKGGNVDPSSTPVVNPLLQNNAPNLEKLYAEMLEGHHVVENAKRLLASTNHVMHHTFRHSEVGL
uniref:Uncharacterized protein n=1 Tax=Ciona savignyi TaxID=51511 RepID=H2ZIQ0_CIOSA